MVVFFKQNTAYELRISDCSSDVCSSDLAFIAAVDFLRVVGQLDRLDQRSAFQRLPGTLHGQVLDQRYLIAIREKIAHGIANLDMVGLLPLALQLTRRNRSEEHTSELQSLMRISYAVFCLKQKKQTNANTTHNTNTTTNKA